MKKLAWQICIGVPIVVIILSLAHVVLPYSPKHLRQIEADRIRRHITSWENSNKSLEYRMTNKSGTTICFFETNIVYNGKTFKGILKLESTRLWDGSYLIATEAKEVFWCNEKGCEPVE